MRVTLCLSGILYLTSSFSLLAVPLNDQQKEASKVTQNHQQQLKKTLPFADSRDFELAEKGLLKRPKELSIKDDQGNVVWNLGQYNFLLDGKDKDSINPSLERQARLNMSYGLYQVAERIYQVRGYDLANMTLIKGDTGWIVFDPLLTPPTAKAAFALVTEHFGVLPIHAVVYSHAHADHFGGVKGIVTQQQVDSGQVQVIAPRDFMQHAIKENVLAGNAMSRRTTYQYGNALPVGAKGQVDAAIGKGTSVGVVSLITPTLEIQPDQQSLEIDGIQMDFYNTPDTESPAEMNTYFPQFKALWTAENVIGALHNVYTLRGAHVRDAQGWSKYINQIIHGYGKDADVMFASHTWPRWGNDYLLQVLKKQRDLYGFLHNQTLHLANKGVTINEIQDELKVPAALASEWYNRGYHGSYAHNAKGIINKYLGYFDMNPANLDKLSPAVAAVKYVEAMGEADSVLQKAQQAYDQGEYRWAAELLNHLVFANPEHKKARYLQADILEQLGYQAESAGWRNTYLMGSYELRHGINKEAKATQGGPDFIRAMSTELVFDFLGVRLNSERAEGQHLVINLVLPDRNEKFLLELENNHLNNIAGVQSDKAQLTLTINRADLDLLLMKQQSFQQLALAGKVKLQGEPKTFALLMSMLEEFPFWFPVVTP